MDIAQYISNMALRSYCPDPDFLCWHFVLGDMPLDQDDEIAFGHGKQSYEILSIPNMAVGSYGRDIETTRGHLHFMCAMSHFSSVFTAKSERILSTDS